MTFVPDSSVLIILLAFSQRFAENNRWTASSGKSFCNNKSAYYLLNQETNKGWTHAFIILEKKRLFLVSNVNFTNFFANSWARLWLFSLWISSDWWGKNTALKLILSSWGDHPTTGHSGFLQGAYSLNPTQCNYELATVPFIKIRKLK